jgi:hypothetical protein
LTTAPLQRSEAAGRCAAERSMRDGEALATIRVGSPVRRWSRWCDCGMGRSRQRRQDDRAPRAC